MHGSMRLYHRKEEKRKKNTVIFGQYRTVCSSKADTVSDMEIHSESS